MENVQMDHQPETRSPKPFLKNEPRQTRADASFLPFSHSQQKRTKKRKIMDGDEGTDEERGKGETHFSPFFSVRP